MWLGLTEKKKLPSSLLSPPCPQDPKMDTLPCLMIFFSMEDFKTIGGIQNDIQYCQLCVCGSIYEYFKERSVTFCAETHSCHVWSSSKNRETKMGLGSSKPNISELFLFSCFLRETPWASCNWNFSYFQICVSSFHKCESWDCSCLCWFLNAVVISKSVLIYSYGNRSVLKVKCNPIKSDTGFTDGEK